MSDNIHNAAPDLVEFLNDQDSEASARAWRDGLKVGDEAIIIREGYTPQQVVVESATNRYVTLLNFRYDRQTGERSGPDWWTPACIAELTPKLKSMIALHVANWYLRDIKWLTLDADFVLDIAARVKAFEAANVAALNARGGESEQQTTPPA